MASPKQIDRAALRTAMRAARQSLDAATHAAAAVAVRDRLLSLLDTLQISILEGIRVGATVSGDGELDPEPTIAVLVQRGATIWRPRVFADRMVFHRLDHPDDAEIGPAGVRQPRAGSPSVPTDTLDLVLVPLVAFDERCERLGRGRGHYDRSFAGHGTVERELVAGRSRTTPVLVGLAHDLQHVADLAPEPHDVALDHVVTPSTVFTRRSTPSEPRH